MSVRTATHAGTWYSGSKSELNNQLELFLSNVDREKLPGAGARVAIGPHAGYSYAGQTLAETYSALDIEGVKRIFILGPSHHVGFRGAMLSKFSYYATPLGNVPVDVNTVDDLMASGLFKKMAFKVDEDEHSFEMHTPYVFKISGDTAQGVRSIVPIMVGTTSEEYDNDLALVLERYIRDPENAFVISTDFCHWGIRFDYTAYTTSTSADDLRTLSRVSTIDPKLPIYKSIELLDRLGMKAASTGSYKRWNEYLDQTDNTICGRTPMGILLNALERAQVTNQLHWIGYTQSSSVRSVYDSSVSYASGYLVI